MFEHFSETARRVIRLGRDEAERLHHNAVGPEHLLFALVSRGEGIALAVLERLGVRRYAVMEELKRALTDVHTRPPAAEIPFNTDALRVLRQSIAQARHFGDTLVGTEHLLLGLLQDADCIAAKTLSAQGASFENVLEATLDLLGKRGDEKPTHRHPEGDT